MNKARNALRAIAAFLSAMAASARNQLDALTGGLVTRASLAYHDESGGVAEKVVIVAIFVALAIAAGTIITTKVIDKANSINLG